MMSYRFGLIFVTKMTFFTVVLILVLLHTMIFARRIRRVSEALDAGKATTAELEAVRMQSFLFSGLLMIVSLGTLWLGVTLGDTSYSYVQR